MASQYGESVWRVSMASQYGESVWRVSMASQYGESVWRVKLTNALFNYFSGQLADLIFYF